LIRREAELFFKTIQRLSLGWEMMTFLSFGSYLSGPVQEASKVTFSGGHDGQQGEKDERRGELHLAEIHTLFLLMGPSVCSATCFSTQQEAEESKLERRTKSAKSLVSKKVKGAILTTRMTVTVEIDDRR
jgi:hypothetical protein